MPPLAAPVACAPVSSSPTRGFCGVDLGVAQGATTSAAPAAGVGVSTQPPGLADSDNIEVRLTKLEELKEKGLVSDEEYASKRAEMLASM